ncbi:MAG: glycoside hydrolase family 20 zincin-like fold domain-containing protein, partial [Pseudomonadota bacterium]
MHIHPQPRFLKPAPRTWLRRTAKPTPINIRSSFASDPRIRSELIALAEDQNLALTYGGSGSEALLCIDEDPSLGDDAYHLAIAPSGARLTSNSTSGLYYGLATLSQILKQSSRQIPCLMIRDSPLFPERGVMLDISRCKVPTLDTIFTLIDQLALLKFNQLQLYIEHTYAFHGHDVVWKDSSPLTTSELLRIQDYCQKHFITLVPNLNSFGHFERWLRHPEYQAFA